MFTWKKRGRIFNPFELDTAPWMQEYAQLPFPLDLDEKRLRIYFATRPQRGADLQYVSRSGFVDVLKDDQSKIVGISGKPIFELGGPGTFDEFGSMTSCFVRVKEEIRAYYTGWTRMQSVPYTMAIGAAVSHDGGTFFEKYSEGPIMGITAQEPFLLSGPIVKLIDGCWHMWYLTGVKWLHDENISKYEPVYKITHATSDDGFTWQRDGLPVMPSLSDDECQVSFALFYYNAKWNVIFAFRKPLDFRENSANSYRLGYASSTDLVHWERDDSQVGLTVSKEGWDSEMIAYPQVGQLNGKIYLYYCGNNFGREGFGYAELEM